jgi:hypothetical protein
VRAVALGLLLLAGCAPTLYRWGGYDEALYDHYKNPERREAFIANLAAVIAEAERDGARVPPGCYAEYGWALYEEGRSDQAIAYFAKESEHWPESRFLMEKLTRNAGRSRAPSKATGPAGAIEGSQR